MHGLFGSAGNWHSIARRLEAEHHLIVPDLRNHGRSPHAEASGYETMAGDIVQILDRLGIGSAALVGHSMGGKVALWLALEHGARVERVVALDIAPVTYSHRFGDILGALESIDLGSLGNRAEADRALSEHIKGGELRGYLLQNLVLEHGKWHWRVNLAQIKHALPKLLDFPQVAPGRQFVGPALFLYGARSNYLQGPYLPIIRSLFPYARLRAVAGAGHWLYAEQPDKVAGALLGFLRS